jgi:arylsulfatase A-like enzyme
LTFFNIKNDADTIVIVTSHGNYFYEAVYANMQMWIIPGSAPTVIRGIGRSVDIAPTLLEIIGIKPGYIDGESMLKYFSGDEFPARDRYAESVFEDGCISMVREDGYKFISTGLIADKSDKPKFFSPSFHKLAVFDLNSDPYEYVNLSAHSRDRKCWDGQ